MEITPHLNLPPWIDLFSIEEFLIGRAGSKKGVFLAKTLTQETVLIAKYEAATRRYEREKRYLSILDGKGAPRLLYHDDSSTLLIRAYVEGAPLADLGSEADLVARCFDVYTRCTNLES